MIKAKTKLNYKYFSKSFLSIFYIFTFFIICGTSVTAVCYPLNKIINYFRKIQTAKYKNRLVYLQLNTQTVISNLTYYINKLQNE